MMRASGSTGRASTSRQQPHPSLPAKPRLQDDFNHPSPSLPAKPRLQDDFNQQDDFISLNDALSDDGSRDYSGKGKGRARDFGGPRGKKRTISEVLDEQGKSKLKDVQKTTPWAADVDWDAHPSAIQQLSAEIKAFTNYVSPTDQEHELRTGVVTSIRRLIQSRLPNAQVHAFGSFETRLYLPTGDIDLVVISPSIPDDRKAQRRTLQMIAGLVRSARLGTDTVVIAGARVPIVKFITVQGRFKVDISLNMSKGIQVGEKVVQLFREVGEEPARSLVLIIKAFLSQRNMNEVFSGGLGSYSIICLVVSFLQLHPKLQKKEIDPNENIGTLLLEFLELYGKHFNMEEVGICVSGGGSYYSKSRRGWVRPTQSYLLSIEDPTDPTHDVAVGSHNIKKVQLSLAGAFEVLSHAVYVRTSIILARQVAAQSGRQLPTLSGRAILQPVGEHNDEVDECRRSLLGSIVGVTEEIEQSRNRVRALAQSNERGQHDNPTAKAAKATKAAKTQPKAAQTSKKPAKKPAPKSSGGQAHAETAAVNSASAKTAAKSLRKAKKLANAQAAAKISGESQSAAKGAEAPPVDSFAQTGLRPAPGDRITTYINLDSDTESDTVALAVRPSEAVPGKGKAVDSDSSDSRYAVKKVLSGTKTADAEYVPNGLKIAPSSSASSDSDVILVTRTTKGSSADNIQGKTDPNIAASTDNPNKRARRNSKEAKTTTSSDMEMSTSASTSAAEKSEDSQQLLLPSGGRGRATSPQRRKLAKRKEFWSSKGEANSHAISSDSGSDTVDVRSK